MRTKKTPSLQINFRDEAYGSVYRPAAFRFGYLGELSKTRISRIHARVRKHGFKYNHQREAWIKEDVRDPRAEAAALIQSLEGLRYEVSTNQFFGEPSPIAA